MGEATGIYHDHNFLKFRIMHAVMLNYGRKCFTSKEIAEITGIPHSKINCKLSQWKWKDCGYFSARKKHAKGTRGIKWQITKKGRITYAKLLLLVQLESRYLNLVRMRDVTHEAEERKKYANLSVDVDPEKLAQYIGITKRGALEFGIDNVKALEIAGIISENTA